MSLDITYYKKINNAYNGTVTLTKKESEIYTLKQHIIKTFNNSLDFHDDVLRNNISQRFVISKYKDNDKKKITAFPNEDLNLGDIIDCFNTKWIVIDLNLDKTIYTKGIMQQCNYQLKWQNSSGDIIQRWIITENSSDIGVKESSVVQIGIDELKLIIPYDTDTVQLRNDKRLFIDNYSVSPTPYQIISVNNTEYVKDGHGYIEIIVKETQKNLNTDRPDLMLCDYISPTTPDTNETTDLSYLSYIDCSKKTIPSGSKRVFTAVFKDTDGNIVNTLTPKWTITCDFEDKLNIVYGTNEITVGVDDDGLIGQTLKLKLEANDNSAEPIEIIVTIVSLY
jgi:hypothetical protein